MVINFCSTTEELRIRYSRYFNYQRTQNKDSKSLNQWFETVQYVIDKHGIQSENIYIFDETGFAMDFIATAKVVIRTEYYSCRAVLQSGNCE